MPEEDPEKDVNEEEKQQSPRRTSDVKMTVTLEPDSGKYATDPSNL